MSNFSIKGKGGHLFKGSGGGGLLLFILKGSTLTSGTTRAQSVDGKKKRGELSPNCVAQISSFCEIWQWCLV